ncbi:MAG: hypothetical protein IPN34_24385 [Planctomycetes bacterium]|nr:hypothetical protein [Planctomycetota bacterium]
MRLLTIRTLSWLLAAAASPLGSAAALPQGAPRAEEPLAARYASRLAELEREIRAALPRIEEPQRAAHARACAAERAAEERAKLAEAAMGELGKAQGLVAHARDKWIGGADRAIAEARARLASATSDAERRAGEQALAKAQLDRAAGVAALAEREATLRLAEQERPRVEAEQKAALAALEQARAQTLAAMQGLGLETFLGSAALDARLSELVALKEATPPKLAAFASRGAAQRELVEQMLGDRELLVQMAVADGPNGADYGRAMEIYRDIQRASAKAREGYLQRFALAIALEHAVPIALRNAEAAKDAPKHVDPVRRYLHYEAASLGGELDPAFERFSVWEYRFVVYGEEPDEILAWGREMLRSYRPDQVVNPDQRWRYVDSVRTDIRYGSEDNVHDEPELQFFQNILKNGGVCGRRAFYGRFLLRAFGIPTTARPQTGHAALVRWTPAGWVPCLGAGWGQGWTHTRYGKDLDFLATTQARACGAAYLQVKRAQWIGDALGEPRVHGFLGGRPEFWYGISLYVQRALIEAARAKTQEAIGQDIAEANETKEKVAQARVTLSSVDRTVVVDERGVITIPAAATVAPTASTKKILFLESNLGGKQLHYNRNGEPQEFEYRLEVPAAGTYALTARVATPSWQQHLLLTLNDAATPIEIPLPFTVGLWGQTAPVEVELVQGANRLRFAHGSTGQPKGFSVRDFTLTPR